MNSIKTDESNLREFHIWDLPSFVRVSFNENIRNQIFKEIFKSIGTLKELTKLIQKETNQKIDYETIRDYKTGKYFIPLWFLNKIVDLFFDKEFYAQIEKEIIAFRGPRGDSIYNPNFPWTEDERIIRIVFRLIGDGHGGGEVSKGRVPVYTNSCSELVEQFVDDLNFFGQVKVRKYIKKMNKTVFLTTHYVEEAMQLCNRIAIMHKGQIIKINAPEKFGNITQEFISLTEEENGKEFS